MGTFEQPQSLPSDAAGPPSAAQPRDRQRSRAGRCPPHPATARPLGNPGHREIGEPGGDQAGLARAGGSRDQRQPAPTQAVAQPLDEVRARHPLRADRWDKEFRGQQGRSHSVSLGCEIGSPASGCPHYTTGRNEPQDRRQNQPSGASKQNHNRDVIRTFVCLVQSSAHRALETQRTQACAVLGGALRRMAHPTPLRIAMPIDDSSRTVVATVTSHSPRSMRNMGRPISRIAPKKSRR